jgi:HK97 family phage major capsid protein
MKIDTQALSLLIEEAGRLSGKPNWTKQDERRNAYLLSAISAVKNGVSLQSIEQDRVNENARSMGLNPTNFNGTLTEEQRSEAKGWQSFLKYSPKQAGKPVELRDMVEGAAAAISRIGSYTGLGFFVPDGFYDGVFAAMAAHDFLFDPESVTFLKTTDGKPIPVPVAGDIENVATLTSEAGSLTSTDISSINHVTLGAYSFSSPRFVVSMEAEQDMVGTLTAIELFKKFASDRLARGIGKYLVTGTGSAQPTGLLQALQNVNAPIVIATGSAGNTGGAETGATSLGTADFANAFAQLNPAYLASGKVAWAMNMNTLGKLMTLVDKMGFPPINFVNGARTILGIPIKICPSMSNIGPSLTPVVLGDWSYWATRYAFDDANGIVVFREAPGLIEQGNVALKVFARADGNLLYTDQSSPCPFVSIMNHS